MLSRRHRRRLLYGTRERLRPLAQRPWRPVATILGLVSLICLASYLTPRPTTTPPSRTGAVVSHSTDHPAEAPIVTYHSTATGTEPKYLSLPSIKAEGFIEKVGVDQHSQMAVPTNIYLAGWFREMAAPGDPGLSIIDGHLDGRTRPGIFANLDHLKPSDIFTVELANGTRRRFSVTSVQSLPISATAAALFSQDPGIKRQLNLITCAGTYQQSKGYDHRIIVTSRLAD